LTRKEETWQKIERPYRNLDSIYWSWQRVKEYYYEMTCAERYEKHLKEIKT
jgi:hypothetical protein